MPTEEKCAPVFFFLQFSPQYTPHAVNLVLGTYSRFDFPAAAFACFYFSTCSRSSGIIDLVMRDNSLVNG